MTEELAALKEMQALVRQQPAEDQEAIHRVAAEIMAIVQANGENGLCALGLLGVTIQAAGSDEVP